MVRMLHNVALAGMVFLVGGQVYAQDSLSVDQSDSLDLLEEEVYEPLDSAEFAALLAPVEETAEERASKRSHVAIKVVDKASKEVIPATVEVTAFDNGGNVLFQGEGQVDENGIFQLDLVPARLELTIVSEGYLPITKRVALEKNGEVKGKISKMYGLTKLSVGEAIPLKNVTFNEGKFALLPESHGQLDALVKLLEIHPDMKIELAGHTDNTGSPAYNQRLSEDRVEAVKRYLVKQGIHPKRIKGVGYGGTKPIVTGVNADSKKNRRVEFVVLKL